MEAAFGILIALQLALLGWFIYHSSQCSTFHERVAALEANIKLLKEEIGDHEHGIRGNLHELRNTWSGPLLWVQRKMEKE